MPLTHCCEHKHLNLSRFSGSAAQRTFLLATAVPGSACSTEVYQQAQNHGCLCTACQHVLEAPAAAVRQLQCKGQREQGACRLGHAAGQLRTRLCAPLQACLQAAFMAIEYRLSHWPQAQAQLGAELLQLLSRIKQSSLQPMHPGGGAKSSAYLDLCGLDGRLVTRCCVSGISIGLRLAIGHRHRRS